jgi:DNA-binding PadR family transcriptional regulator
MDISMLDKMSKTPARPPLKPAAFHILLALASEPRHGLGIADEVESITGGAVQLGPGTLYRTLKDLTAGGLIREVRAPGPDADPRRRYYAPTDAGRAALEADVARYDRLSRLARKRGVLPAQAP